MKMKFQRQIQHSLLIFVGFVFCLHTGCKQKDTPGQDTRSAPSPGAQIQSPQSGHDELYRMAEQPFEHDPAKRPLVLSRPAANRREWVLQSLKQGYQDTGKTNKDWDAKVQAAFEAF